MATVSRTKLQNFINGEFVDSAEGATEEVTNPATGEVVAHVPALGDKPVELALFHSFGAGYIPVGRRTSASPD